MSRNFFACEVVPARINVPEACNFIGRSPHRIEHHEHSKRRLGLRQSELPLPILNVLGGLLKGSDWEVQISACYVLSQAKSMHISILQELAAMLKHPNRGVQVAAREALSQLSELPVAVLENIVALIARCNYKQRWL